MRRRLARARGYDRLGELQLSPPSKAAAVGGDMFSHGKEIDAALRSQPARCNPRRCPYLKTPMGSLVALAAAALVIVSGTVCLSGLGGSVRLHTAASAEEGHAHVGAAQPRQERPRRGKRGKQKAVTSLFRRDRAVAAEHEDSEFSSSWVWISQADRARGFSLTHTVPDSQRAEVAVLFDEVDECGEGWQGESCLDCAPGFSGDFCTPEKPQLDLYNYQVKLPPTAEVHLRDYLPRVLDNEREIQWTRGSEVFSDGVNVAQVAASAA